MDGLETVKICTAYDYEGERISLPPYGADALEACTPVYETMPGWQETTAGMTNYDDLPVNARKYLDRISDLTELPIDIVSTGAERDHTIIRNHPFA